MKYYSLLKTTATSDILSIPIREVILRYTADGVSILSKPRVYRDGAFYPKYETIGDLLKLGREGTYDLISQDKLNREQIDDAIYSIEEGLASIGLKFADSDFTVGDVRLKSLGLGEEVMSIFDRSIRKVKTIDDIVIFGKERFVALGGAVAEKNMPKLNWALEKFGMKMEGSGHGVNRDNQFPLDAYYEYLSDETRARLNITRKSMPMPTRKAKKPLSPAKTPEELSRMNKSDLLNLEVAAIGIQRKVVSRLEELGIFTIGDLVSKGYKFYISTDGNPGAYSTIKNRLAAIGLKFEGANYTISNGSAVPGPKLSVALSEYAIMPFDINEKSEQEKQEFFNMPIRDFGFSAAVYNALNGKVKTMGELIQKIKSKTLNAPTNIISHIKSCLLMYKINLNGKKVVDSRAKGMAQFINLQELKALKHFDALDEAGKAERLSQKLTESALNKELAEQICEKLGISTVGELHSTARDTLREVLGNRIYSVVCTFMSVQGLKLAFNNSWQSEFDESKIVDFKAMTEQQQSEFLSEPVSRLGLRPSTVDKLSGIGISSIGELVDHSFRSLDSTVGRNVVLQVAYIVRKFNMSLKREVPKRITQEKAKKPRSMVGYSLNRMRSAKELFVPFVSHLDPNSDEARDIVKNTSVENIGLGSPVVATLKRSDINTLGDIVSLTKRNLRVLINNDYVVKKIETLIGQYGLSFKPAETKTSVQHESASKPVRGFHDKVLEKKYEGELAQLGISEEDVKTINAHGLYTLEDIVSRSYGDIVVMFPPKIANMLFDVVTQNGRMFKAKDEGLNFGSAKRQGGLTLETRIVDLDCDRQEKVDAIMDNVIKIGDFLSISNVARARVIKSCKSIVPAIQEVLRAHGKDIKSDGEIVDYKPEKLTISVRRKTTEKPQQKPRRKRLPHTKAVSLDDAESWSSEEKQQLLSLENSGLHGITIQRLKDANITSLSDLKSKTTGEVMGIAHNYGVDVRRIRKILKLNGMGFSSERRKTDHRYTEDGQVICPVFENLGVEEAKKQPVRALGVSEKSAEKLAALGIITVGDISKLKKSQLKRIVNSHGADRYIIKVFEKYGVPFAESNSHNDDYLNIEFRQHDLFGGKTYDSMTEDEREQFLNTHLSKFGIMRKVQDRFDTLDIQTIGDFMKRSYKDMAEAGVPESTIVRLRRVLRQYGFAYDSREGAKHIADMHKIDKFKGKKFFDMTEEEKAAFLNLPIGAFITRRYVAESFENAGIKTIGDFTEATKSVLTKQGFKGTSLASIRRRLVEFGYPVKEPSAEDEPTKKGDVFDHPALEKFGEKTYPDMTEEERRQFEALDVACMGLSKVNCKRLQDNGILTVGDVSKVPYKLLLEMKVSGNATTTISHFFTKFKMKRRLHSSSDYDISKLDQYSLEEGLSLPIETLDLTLPQIENMHSQEVHTIGDLAKLGVTDLWNFNGRRKFVEYINAVKERFGLEVVKSPGQRLRDFVKSVNGKNFYSMSQEEQDQFLATPLGVIGVGDVSAKHLADIGIRTLGDAINSSYSTIKFATSSDICDKIRGAINVVGLDFVSARKEKIEKPDALDTAEFAAMTDDQKEKALDLPFEEFGIYIGADALRQAGINSMRDLTEVDGIRLYELAGRYGYHAITERAEKYGIELRPREHFLKKRRSVEDIPPTPYAQMSDQEKESLCSIELKHVFNYAAAKRMRQQGFATLGDVLERHEEFIKRSRHDAGVKQKLREVCARFQIDLGADWQKNNNEVELGKTTRIRLRQAGFETIEQIANTPKSVLREKLGARVFYGVELAFRSAGILLKDDPSADPTLLERLKEGGVDIILQLSKEDLAEGSEKRKELDEALTEFYTWWYQTKVFTSSNERLLLLNNQLLEQAKEKAAANINQVLQGQDLDAKSSVSQPSEEKPSETEDLDTSENKEE